MEGNDPTQAKAARKPVTIINWHVETGGSPQSRKANSLATPSTFPLQRAAHASSPCYPTAVPARTRRRRPPARRILPGHRSGRSSRARCRRQCSAGGRVRLSGGQARGRRLPQGARIHAERPSGRRLGRGPGRQHRPGRPGLLHGQRRGRPSREHAHGLGERRHGASQLPRTPPRTTRSRPSTACTGTATRSWSARAKPSRAASRLRRSGRRSAYTRRTCTSRSARTSISACTGRRSRGISAIIMTRRRSSTPTAISMAAARR